MKSGKETVNFSEAADLSRLKSHDDDYQEDPHAADWEANPTQEQQAEPELTDDEYWDRENEPEDPHAPRQEDFPTYNSYENANIQYQTNKALHGQAQKAQHDEAMVNIVGEAMARQGIGDLSDEFHDEKMELGKYIRSLGDRIQDARTDGKHREALELQIELQREWKRLEKIPPSKAVQQAEQKNIDHLGTQWTTWMNQMQDPAFVKNLTDQYGHEKVLQDVKTWMNQINRLHDGTVFAVLRCHADRYGRPNEIKPGDLRIVKIDDREIANSIRREIIAGFDPEEALLRAGMIPELPEEDRQQPTPDEKKAKELALLERMTPEQREMYLEQREKEKPVKPLKDPDKMTQAEYEAWREKGGGI